MSKHEFLENAVLTETPGEVEHIFRSLGRVDLTARALGLACRYCGVEMVEVLVNCGAKFTFDVEKYALPHRKKRISFDDKNYAAALLPKVLVFNSVSKRYGVKMLPMNERLAVLEYLLETADKTELDKDELLFYAYFSDEQKMIDRLKQSGAVLPEYWIKIMTEGAKTDEDKEKWFNYCVLMGKISDKRFLFCMSMIVSELGGRKLHYTDWLWEHSLQKRREIPGFFKFFAENFDASNINKSKMMRYIIDKDRAEELAVCAEQGWLKTPRKRDEMIVYSAEKGSTECTAFLLDFKNRNFDIAAERERAEKRAMRELLADPNSVTELKKLWSFQKRDDNTLVITSYKGTKTEIAVPEKIGKSTVTAIDNFAFSPNARRLREEQRELRRALTAVELPDTITSIGRRAFYNCPNITVIIGKNPYAEKFCIGYKIPFENK